MIILKLLQNSSFLQKRFLENIYFEVVQIFEYFTMLWNRPQNSKMWK